MGQPVQPAQAVIQPAALAPPASLEDAINFVFNATVADQGAAAAWAAANPQVAAPELGGQLYQYYINQNQAGLRARYGFDIPLDDTSYIYRHVEVAQAEQGTVEGRCPHPGHPQGTQQQLQLLYQLQQQAQNQQQANQLQQIRQTLQNQVAVCVNRKARGTTCNPNFYGLHAHNICQATTNALAFVLTELIQNQKYMQAGEQLQNCINRRNAAMAGWGGGNPEHLRVVGVLRTLQEIINRVGIQNIVRLWVQGANLNVTINQNQQLRFYRVIHPGPNPQRALQVGNPRLDSRISFAQMFGPGDYFQHNTNLQGGKRKTRYIKKSKKSKTRKH